MTTLPEEHRDLRMNGAISKSMTGLTSLAQDCRWETVHLLQCMVGSDP